MSMLKNAGKNATKIARSLAQSWRQPTREEALRRKWAGRTGTDVECLAVRMARLPGPAEVRVGMGANSRQVMDRLGIRLAQTSRNGALLSAIDQSCKRCRDWRLCTRWLAQDGDPEAYRSFCPNVARWDELLQG